MPSQQHSKRSAVCPSWAGGILSFHNLTDIKRVTADKLLIHIFRYKPDQIDIAALTGLTHAADSLLGLDQNKNPIASVADLYTYRFDFDYINIEQVLSNAYKNHGCEPIQAPMQSILFC